MKFKFILFPTIVLSLIIIFIEYSMAKKKVYNISPQSIKESKDNNVYLHTYKPTKKFLLIDKTRFYFKESWTSYKYPNNKKNEINKKLSYLFLTIYSEKNRRMLRNFEFEELQITPITQEKQGYMTGVYNDVYYLKCTTKTLPFSPDTVGLLFGKSQDTVLFIKQRI